MAMAISPTVMKVMPSPRKGWGTSPYCIFSRIAPIDVMASTQPIPEPKAYTMASQTEPMYCVLLGSRLMRCCMNREAPMMAQFTAINGRKIPSEAYREGE